MDIAQANQILDTLIKQKTDEIAALTMAKGVLNSTFSVDFINLDTVLAEKEDLKTQLDGLKNEPVPTVLTDADAAMKDLGITNP